MNSELTGWIAACFALSLFFAAQGVYWLRRRKAYDKETSLKRRLRGQKDGGLAEAGILIREAGKEGVGSRQAARFARFCEQAGLKSDPARVAIRVGALGLIMGLLGLALFAAAIGFFVGAGTVIALAYLYLSIRRDKRRQAFTDQLPQALEAMVFALRAGRGLEEAIGLSAAESKAPLSEELGRVFEDTSLGKPVEQALAQLGARWPNVRALKSFVEAVGVLKRTGGNMIAVMHNISDSIRARASYEARHRALTAEGRTSGRILMGLPVLAFLVQAIMTPEQLKVLFSEEGQNFFFASLGLWILGMLWIRRLARPAG